MPTIRTTRKAKGETLTARQILDRAAARVDTELADQPAVQAEMASTIGDLYYDFGVYGPSLALLKQSATLHDRLDDPLALRAQAWVDVGVTERVVGDTAAASRSLEHALALARSAGPDDSALTATTLVELGATFELASDYAAAGARARPGPRDEHASRADRPRCHLRSRRRPGDRLSRRRPGSRKRKRSCDRC